MSQQGFLDLNEGRAYPFTVDAPSGVYREVVVDLAIRLGDDLPHDLTDEDLRWRLREITLGTNGVSWDFKFWQHDGSAYVAGTELVINVGTGAEKFSTHYGATAGSQSHAYMTVADISKIVAGSTPEAPVEQRTIITAVGTESQSVTVYNAKRRQPYAPNLVVDPNNSPGTDYENAKAATDAFVENVVDEAGTSVAGPVIPLISGYNCRLTGDQAQSLISIILAVGEGLGQKCESLSPDLRAFTKQGALRTLNGQQPSNGELVLRNGRNMSVQAVPDQHKIQVVVGSPTLAGKCPTGKRDRNTPDPLPEPPGGCQHPDDSSASSDVSAESSASSVSGQSLSTASSSSLSETESSVSTSSTETSSSSTTASEASSSSSSSPSSITESLSTSSSSSVTETPSSLSTASSQSSVTQSVQTLSSLSTESSPSSSSTSSESSTSSSSSITESLSTSSTVTETSSTSSVTASTASSQSSITESLSSYSSYGLGFSSQSTVSDYTQSTESSQSTSSSKTVTESSQSPSSSSETESQSSQFEVEPAPYCDTLQNASFEDDTQHWVNQAGTWQTTTDFAAVDGQKSVYPGPFAVYGELYQDVDISAASAAHLDAIDDGKSYLDFSGWTQSRWADNNPGGNSSSSSSQSTQSDASQSSYEFSGDVCRFRIFFYGSDGSLLGSFDSGWLGGPDSTWVERSFAPDIPAFTRRIRVMLVGRRNQVGDTACDSYFDALGACLTVKGLSSSSSSSSSTASSPTSGSTPSTQSEASTSSSSSTQSDLSTASTATTASAQSELTADSSASTSSTQSDVSTASTPSSDSSSSSSSQSDVSTATTESSPSSQSELTTESTASTSSSSSSFSDLSTATTESSPSSQSDLSTASTASTESSSSSSSISDQSTASTPSTVSSESSSTSTPSSESTVSDQSTASSQSSGSSESSESSSSSSQSEDESTSSSFSQQLLGDENGDLLVDENGDYLVDS